MRADAENPNMGLLTWASAPQGGKVRKADVAIAKNYLNEDELNMLNRIVNAYLELAEVQALDKKPMTMRQWLARLDDFIRLSGREILTHAGRISAEVAQAKADAEYQIYQQRQLDTPGRAEQDFEAAIGKQIKAIEQSKPAEKNKKGKTK